MQVINYDQVKQKMEEMGYIATDELIWNAVMLLNNFVPEVEMTKGQDISAVCLDGPPGSGKTEFAKTMKKLVESLLGDSCEMISYQCDPTTGKNELYEDINAAAAVAGDPSAVIVNGALINAIKKVNEGKKVLLFIDEYDKAREETDAFFLDFLQSGRISTTQNGVMEIEKPEYRKNLSVLLCKNDNREYLSGPLTDRLKFIHLEEMNPYVFNVVAKRVYHKNEDVANFVTILYELAYKNKDSFERLPSCRSMLKGIGYAINYTNWDAPNFIVYDDGILNNMFKIANDKQVFLSLLKSSKNKIGIDLSALTSQNKNEYPSIIDIMNKEVGAKYKKKFEEEMKKLENLKEKFLPNNLKVSNNLSLKGSAFDPTKIIANFPEEENGVIRSRSVFAGSENWTKIATLICPKGIKDKQYLETILKITNTDSKSNNFKVYENGFRINAQDAGVKINVVRVKTGQESEELMFYSNKYVLPSTIFDVIGYVTLRLSGSKNSSKAECFVPDLSEVSANFDGLVFSKKSVKSGEKIADNLYHMEINAKDIKNFFLQLQDKISNDSSKDYSIEELDACEQSILDAQNA